MLLQIISPAYKKTFSISWLEVDTPVGNFVIQKGHAPTVLTLQPDRDVIYRLKNGQQKTLMIKMEITHRNT